MPATTETSQMLSHRALHLLVFASGAAGLAYEISWSRQLGLTFGQTARAAAIVLGAYFLGMALGYALAAVRSARMRMPLAGYAVAEVVVGVWALVVPTLLGLAPTHISGGASRLLLALLVLLPGTTALGASLPFIAHATAGRSGGTKRVASLYASNLAGAVLGIALATGMLAPVGVVATSRVAAATSIAVGGVAWVLRRRFAVEPCPPRDDDGLRSDRLWLIAAALSGIGAIAAQILYVRLFSLVFHNSTYTFAAILLVVLIALSAASSLGGHVLRRFDPRAALVAACITAAAALPVSVAAFLQLQGFRYFGWGEGLAAYMLAATALVAAVVFVPVLAMGVVLPLAWHLAGADERPGPVVGRLTTANTLGAAVGAIGTSFIVVPMLDLFWSFAAISALYLVLAGVVVAPLPQRRTSGVFIVFAALVSVGATLLSTGVSTLTKWDQVVLKRFTGPYGWTEVTTDAEGYNQRIRHNVHYGLGSRGSSAMQLRQGHFPLLLHPDPQDVAFIGLATGVTASAALDLPDVRRITVMELIPEVVDAARMFGPENRDLLEDPRVSLQLGDGRSLLGAADARYDVVVSDLFVPWESKTGYLYTVEHFAAVRERLAPGGIFCQWLAGWQIGSREFETIVQSLREAFPHVAVWQLEDAEKRPLFALVGVDAPRTVSRASLQTRMNLRRAPSRGAERVLRTADDVVAWYLGDWVSRPEMPLNTDEHPRVEFSAPMSDRRRSLLLRDDRFHAYYAERLRSLPRRVFTFDPPARDGERALPR